ncbi:hypothetical protein PAXRUDRAFT_21962 [Paxillus rubicundulus Ve08.2h10]|uniref:Uncharacterized protein n=1 Tax=Paxillus rubicundulus Ve08.2h10 TaxID=930991 RepID=A0A0D0D6H1_9AGAM|nr:hypothetical protein PAXRUDRAFT_21962 [Paxillus rubicundulus Ve08.2h10]
MATTINEWGVGGSTLLDPQVARAHRGLSAPPPALFRCHTFSRWESVTVRTSYAIIM